MRPRPIGWITVGFAAGAGIGLLWPLNALFTAFIAFLVLDCCLFFWRRSAGVLAAFMALAFLLGGLRAHIASRQTPSPWPDGGLVTLQGTLQTDPELLLTASHFRLLRADMHVERWLDGPHSSIPLSQDIRVYLPAPPNIAASPLYGDRIEVHGKIAPSMPLRDPGSPACCSDEGSDSRLVLIARGDFAWRRLPSRPLQAPFQRAALFLQRRALAAFRGYLPGTEVGLLSALLFGNRQGLAPELASSFDRTGATYLLATAGLHVGMFTLLLLWMAQRVVGMPRKMALLLTVCALGLFVVMAGGRPAVLRAATMLGLYLMAPLFEREPDFTGALCASALLLLLWNPQMLLTPGFQLSYAVVITIALLAPVIEYPLRHLLQNRLHKTSIERLLIPLGRFLYTTLFLSLAAQIGAAPLVAYHFHTLSVTAPMANFCLLLVALPLLFLGYAAVLVAAVHPLLAHPLLLCISIGLKALIGLSALFSKPLWAELSVGSPPIGLIVLLYGLLLIGLLFLRHTMPLHQLPIEEEF
ncbi:ComEC/Rec2-related protein [Chthonomonas calidirosea]|uniref:ComEC/Rec2-related protein n=1 Tax=Chthonomonas calidirosea (strain DSM 23976 / ICMP 18418 / T49) TaxID=1303518 RepID=S0EWF8_CHTCT|nr:ComEC/Rec2 family competence protein [Chthonomonas calidirosea]CCW35749.1 ComEC/Rec2-related protein [Chthonomonas calidirosea T49]CEK19352.1 ComEC/Rec2-related protein [Chthonomonas calidirosea]